MNRPFGCHHRLHLQDCQNVGRYRFSGEGKDFKKNDGENQFLHRFPIEQTQRVRLDQDSVTVIALVGQTAMQLSQPKHSSMFTGSDFSSRSSKTPTGQVSTQLLHPSHLSLSTVTVYMLLFLLPGWIEIVMFFHPVI